MRQPAIEAVAARVRVEFAGLTIASTRRAFRVREMGHSVYYIPRADVRMLRLEPGERRGVSDGKGTASCWSVRVGARFAPDAAWSYADPEERYEALRDHIAFDPSRVDACWVGHERVVDRAVRAAEASASSRS